MSLADALRWYLAGLLSEFDDALATDETVELPGQVSIDDLLTTGPGEGP